MSKTPALGLLRYFVSATMFIIIFAPFAFASEDRAAKKSMGVRGKLCRACASAGYEKAAGMMAWCEDCLWGIAFVKHFRAGEACRTDRAGPYKQV